MRPSFEVIRHDITRDVPPDPDMQAIVQKYGADMEEGMKEEIGRFVYMYIHVLRAITAVVYGCGEYTQCHVCYLENNS